MVLTSDGLVLTNNHVIDGSTAISGHKPGDSVSLTWTDTSGSTQSATVKLIQGPAA